MTLFGKNSRARLHLKIPIDNLPQGHDGIADKQTHSVQRLMQLDETSVYIDDKGVTEIHPTPAHLLQPISASINHRSTRLRGFFLVSITW